jgi:cephalosporin-C deacetylase-like acetyl esterase
MKKIFLTSVLFSMFCLIRIAASAQDTKVQIEITPDHADWVYAVNEPVKFKVSITQDKKLLKNTKVKYTLAFEKMKVYLTQETILKEGTLEISAEGMNTPGFLTCRVFVEHDGQSVNSLCQVGFEPEKLRPMTDMPVDFVKYWNDAKADNAKIPMNPVMTRSEEYSNDKVDCYRIRVDNYRAGAHLYGYLAIPKGKGPFPAVLNVPGAGVAKMAPARGLAEKGVITLQIGIHGIPFTMEDSVYIDLRDAALYGYQYNNLDVRDQYYYKRVFMGCVRAIDFLFTLPQFDGKRLAVTGGSQGGALSIITTALDPRVKYLVSYYPALCDHLGYIYNRAGGWPHMFDEGRAYFRTAERIMNSKYYDAANFARLIKVPGFFSWGYNDPTCPVTSMYSAYNVVTAPKELFLELRNGHTRSRRQNEASDKWLLEKLGVR